MHKVDTNSQGSVLSRVLITTLFYFIYFLSGNLFGNEAAKKSPLSLEDLKPFYPGSLRSEIQAKFGEGFPAMFQKKKNLTAVIYTLSKSDVVVDIIVQFFNEKVYDFYVTFPSYFRHDPWHKALIKELGIQQEYLLSEEAAVYHWKGDLEVFYGANCTITCFSSYLTVYPNKGEISKKMEVMPLFWQFLLAEKGDRQLFVW